MAAATIVQAVLERFVAGGMADFDASKGMFFEEMPEQLTLPFIGFQMGNETCEYTSEDSYQERGVITFTIFAVTVAETERLALLVKAVYDACVKHPQQGFSIQSATVDEWQRTGYRVTTADFRDAENNLIGQAEFSYSYIVQRYLPS